MKSVRLHPFHPVALAVLAATGSLQAQESGSTATTAQAQQLPPVIVTAPRYVPTPAATGAVTPEQLPMSRAATSDTASLLADVPGVSVQSAGGVSGLPSIRGLTDDRLRIKVDGMDLIASCPNHMNPPLSYLDPNQVGSIKVWAGISPVSVGGDSIGGAIVAETPPPAFVAPGEPAKLSGDIGAHYRSNGSEKGLHLNAGYATDQLAISYRGAAAESENYTAGGDFKKTTATGRPGHTLPLDEVGSTAYKTSNHALDLAWRDQTQMLEAKIGHQEVPYQLYPNQRMDMLANDEDRVNLHYQGKFHWGKLDARVYHESVDHFMDFGADKQYVYGMAPYVVAPGMPMYTSSTTNGMSLQAELLPTDKDVVRLGMDAQAYRLDDWWPPSPSDLSGMLFSAMNPVPATYAGMAPDTFWNINDGKRDRVGIYGEWEATWSPQWTSVVGARYERVTTDTGEVQGYNSVANNMMYSTGYLISARDFNAQDRKRTDNNIDLALMARHTPDANHTYEFGFARKTRSPNLYERYSWSRNAMAAIMNNFVGDGNGYLGNPDLKPEVAHTLSASLSVHSADKKSLVTFSPFYTHVSDYIDAVEWDRNTNRATTTPQGQFGILKYMNQSARLYGFELSGKTPIARNAMGDWSLSGLLNYTNGRNQDTGNGLYNVMPLNAKLALHQKSGDWSNTLELVAVKAKTKVSSPRQEVATPGYSLLNWRSSVKVQKVRIDFGIENLLDKLYYLPTGGTYTGQGMTMSMNGIPAGIAVPGKGRSLYVGMNYQF